MNEKRKAYVVTKGEYSDCVVECVFLSREKALAWCNRMKESLDEEEREFGVNDYRVEEHCIGDDDDTLLPLEKIGICGRFNLNDELTWCNVVPRYFEPLGFSVRYFHGEPAFIEFMGDLSVRKGESLEAFEQRARKVAIDGYFAWKAANA